ncbi:hypothetical protein [Blastococcus sp. TF02A-35]|uniref:LppU/SCO3897 family protein n=1 Tax=Blastococcus sp. TF02A-35 TaxID=2559612 RepID=UPI0014313F77|nr:hypothetical protein [Blastococcus sp. TF02A_35]
MSHPGTGPDMNPSGQQPGQPGQPFPQGQPGQPYPQGQPGQPYPQGQPGQPYPQGQPGQPYQQFEQQPGQPAGAWTPPAGQPAKKGGAWKKVLPVVGGVVVLGAAASAFGLLGGGPDVGDCIAGTGATSFEEVDCGSGEADGKVVGIQEEEMTYSEFEATEELCLDFETAELALWIGPEGNNEDGKVYCAEPV